MTAAAIKKPAAKRAPAKKTATAEVATPIAEPTEVVEAYKGFNLDKSGHFVEVL